MKKGDAVYTPRFCTVRIEDVFETRAEAGAAGYKEPTYYEKDGYTVLGKSLDVYHMTFAACKTEK